MPPSSRWSLWLRSRRAQGELESWFRQQPLPPLVFAAVNNVELPPRNDEVLTGNFYRVVRKGQAKWALFLCPCGCAEVITLSLQRIHSPRWAVKHNKTGRPTMWPSVWRDIGCLSHFWIDDGRVYWCHNTGTSPQEFSSW